MDAHKLIFSMTVERSDRTFVSGRWVGGIVGDDAVEVVLMLLLMLLMLLLLLFCIYSISS